MSIDRFIPQVWSAKLLLELRKALVFGQEAVINRDYEGEIKDMGDTVRIHNFGAITIFDYGKDGDMPAAETLTDDELTLKIDQSKAFNFQIDDIDSAQQNTKIMAAAMSDAAFRLADKADSYIASLYPYAEVQMGTDAAPVSLTKDNIYDKLVDLSVALDENDAPQKGRFAILPPWAYGLLLKDDRFVATGGAAAEGALANGEVGSAAGFTIMKSNNIVIDNAKYRVLAGHKTAWSFAEQINQVEGYRPERRFSDAVKGLHLYGAKVVRPKALACLTAVKP